MKVDIYRREEPGARFSYLIVPHDQRIPQEAENTDWHMRQMNVHIDEAAQHLHPYEVERPQAQIDEKGYAITRLADQVPAHKASV